MAQWMSLNRKNSFVNRTRLPLLCENSETIFLVVVNFMAGRAGRQSDEMLVVLKIFKILYQLHC